MKQNNIGIITHYNVHNHGAQLQLLALEKILREKKCIVSALTFKKDYKYMNSEANVKYSINIKSIPYYLKYLKEQGLKKTFFNIYKKFIFDSFRKKNDMLGGTYSNFSGDLLIIGSDEVFSTEVGITDAFWGVNSKSKKLVSYAASFGPTTLQDINRKKESEFITDSLFKFDVLSVRDKNSFQIINALTKIQPEIVCDPVILYGYKKEISKFTRKKGNYILLYSYDKNMNDKEEISLIKNIALKLNLKIFSVGFFHSWCDRNINANPIDLLSYFANAKYVITDTFHGSVMSLITEANFAVLIRNSSNKILNLLDEYNLQNRIFKDYESCLQVLSHEIGYQEINKIMESNRSRSMMFLESIIS